MQPQQAANKNCLSHTLADRDIRLPYPIPMLASSESPKMQLRAILVYAVNVVKFRARRAYRTEGGSNAGDGVSPDHTF